MTEDWVGWSVEYWNEQFNEYAAVMNAALRAGYGLVWFHKNYDCERLE